MRCSVETETVVSFKHAAPRLVKAHDRNQRFKSGVELFFYVFALSWPAGLPFYLLFKLRALPDPVLAWMDSWFGAGAIRGVSAKRAGKNR